MTVIAMTREMGTLGKDVAGGIANKLGLDVVHHEVVERDVAGRMELEESDVHRFLEGSPSLLQRWKIDQNRLSRFTQQEVLELAEKGNVVIRGWGATSLLKSVPHVIRVRVCAPMEFRVNVIRQRLGLKDSMAARREIERNDDAHGRALRNLADPDWHNPLHYDLVLNTDRVPVELGVDMVHALTQSPAFQVTASSRQLLANLILESKIRHHIDSHPELGVTTRHIDIEASEAKVVLSGTVLTESEADRICEAVRSVTGTIPVANQFVVTASGYHHFG